MRAEALGKGSIVFFDNEVHWVLAILLPDEESLVVLQNQKQEEIVVNINLIRGVYLNPIWMKRLGFSYRVAGIGGQDQWAGYGTWEHEEAKIYFHGHKKISDTLPLFYGRNREFRFEFVHEVQNLYLALKKEEIKTTNETT